MVQKKKKNKNLAVKFLGCLTKKGKKSVFRRIFSNSVNVVCKTLKFKSGFLMKKVSRNLGTLVEIRKVRIRRNTYLVPVLVNSSRRNYLITKNILDSVNKNSLKIPLEVRLSKELITIVRKKNSTTLNEKVKTLKEAAKNKSNTHFRW